MAGDNDLESAIASSYAIKEVEEKMRKLSTRVELVESLVFGNEKLGIKSLVKIIEELSEAVEGLIEFRKRLGWMLAGIGLAVTVTAGASVSTWVKLTQALAFP